LHDTKAYQRAKAWDQTLKTLSTLPDDWVIDEGEKFYQFSPLWPGRRASGALFRQIPKIVLMSGTIRPKTIELLGVDRTEYEFFEYESPFDPERSPVYWVPTVRVDNRISAEQETLWLRRMDQIIRTRQDRKGIIHAVSYRRAKYIMSQSEFRSRMVTHSKDSGSAAASVERFKASAEPLILVSPSVTTGYDFPGEACRFQIIAKIPFPDNRDQRNLASARKDEDPEYAMYGVLQQIVQAAGRSTRSEDDWSEVFLIDDHAAWTCCGKKYAHLMPKGFKVYKTATIPDGGEFRRRWEGNIAA
jgi:Rad3-related DNA helicase